ncbi:MAG: flagellar basal body-associated FliL family protein [Roseiarcus sp.]|jgi:flagellar FliL protein
MPATAVDEDEEVDAAETPPPPPPPPAPSSIKQTIIAILAVTVIAVAMGALFAIPPAAETPSQKNDSGLAEELPPTARLFDMPPIVTNLGEPRDTWIRLEASIVFDAKALPHPEVIAGEIAGDELAYLHTVALTQIEGPIGLQNVRQDLNERAVIRSGGKVTELIIRTLVVQ